MEGRRRRAKKEEGAQKKHTKRQEDKGESKVVCVAGWGGPWISSSALSQLVRVRVHVAFCFSTDMGQRSGRLLQKHRHGGVRCTPTRANANKEGVRGVARCCSLILPY